jgi:hypothetical protein
MYLDGTPRQPSGERLPRIAGPRASVLTCRQVVAWILPLNDAASEEHAMRHWLRRHCTRRGRVIGARLRAAYQLRVTVERAEAMRAAIRTRAELEQRLFRPVKEGA